MREKGPIQQRIEAFEARHGGPKAAVKTIADDGSEWWLYPDGAMRDVNPHGPLQDPPELHHHPYRGDKDAHSWELLQRRIRYHEAKVALRVRDFEWKRASMMDDDYSEHDMQELQRLAKRHNAAQKELDRVLEERESHPVYQRQQFVAEQQAKTESRIKEKSARLKKMRI